MSFESEWNMSLPEALADLDQQLRVVIDGKVQCCVGLLGTFYLEDTESPATRVRAVDAYERYVRAVPEGALVWGADPKTGTPRKLVSTDVGNVRGWAPRVAPSGEFSYAYKGGSEKDDADVYMVKCLLGADTPDELGYVSFALPLSWVGDRPAGAFVNLVLDFANILKPTHGYAGLAVIPHVNESGRSSAMPSVVSLVSRFRGLEFDLPWLHSIHLAKLNKIKGINWLTVLARKWEDELGGVAELAEELGPEITLRRWDDGVIIQAGDHPLFGDVNRKEPMPLYGRVARAIEPIRPESMGSFSSVNGFTVERTDQWLHRFDND